MPPRRRRRSPSSAGPTRTAARWRKTSTTCRCRTTWSSWSRTCGRRRSPAAPASRSGPAPEPAAVTAVPGVQGGRTAEVRAMATYAATEGTVASAVRVRGQAKRQQAQDRAFHLATLLFAALVLLILGGIIVSLVEGALPALRKFGLGFVTSNAWNPVKEQFGGLPAVYGTLVTSAIAMLIGVPVSFGIAIFITELCPVWLKRPLGIAIELLAGIPSIIYGIWGLFSFAPLMQATVQPALIDTIGDVPWIGDLFQGPPYGIGTLTAGIILAVMILPFITSIT